MGYPIYLGAIGDELAKAIDDELRRAREKFPEPIGSMTALTEEVGELAKAMLDEPSERIRKEAIQVAVMAIRVATEGDPTLNAYRKQRRGLPPHPVPEGWIEPRPPEVSP